MVWVSGGGNGKEIYLTKNPCSLVKVFFYKLTKNTNLTKNFFFFSYWGEGGGGVSVRTRTNVSNGTSTLQGEHLCKIILKFLHIYRSYGLEKLVYVTFKCDLDLQPT